MQPLNLSPMAFLPNDWMKSINPKRGIGFLLPRLTGAFSRALFGNDRAKGRIDSGTNRRPFCCAWRQADGPCHPLATTGVAPFQGSKGCKRKKAVSAFAARWRHFNDRKSEA
jgi:hypothetical protein